APATAWTILGKLNIPIQGSNTYSRCETANGFTGSGSARANDAIRLAMWKPPDGPRGSFGRVGGDPCIWRRLAESPAIEIERIGIGIDQIRGIIGAEHPNVGDVIEDRSAVFAIGGGIENVLVPHLIDDLAGDDVSVGVNQLKGKEAPVLSLH